MDLSSCSINGRDFTSHNAGSEQTSGAYTQTKRVPAKIGYTLYPDCSLSDIDFQFEANDDVKAVITLAKSARIRLDAQTFHLTAAPATPEL